MANEWSPLTGVDLSPVESAAETVADVSASIAEFLDIVAAALRLISLFVGDDLDIIKSLVNAAIDTLENMILDLLSNNVAIALHVNMRWDRSWKYRPSVGEVHPNWAEGRDLPWSANGLNGWLLDVAASSFDRADPFAPLTDEDTMVGGFIYVIGVPSFSDIADIASLFDAFTDFSDFREVMDQERLEISQAAQALSRAKQALYSGIIRDTVEDSFTAIAKTKLDSGTDGVIAVTGTDTVEGEEVYTGTFTALGQDFLTSIPNTAGAPDGTTVVLVNGSSTTLTVTAVSDNENLVYYSPTIPESTAPAWSIYEQTLNDAMNSALNDWSFQEGTFPKWMSVPIARVFPPVGSLLEKLRDIVNALRMPSGNVLSELAELLAKRAEILADLALEINDIIQQLLALAALLEGGYFLWITKKPDANNAGAGMNGFIGEALAAENAPDFGDDAIFGGVVGVVTVDDPLNHLESFFQLVGVTVSEYVEDQTERAEQIDATLEDAAAYFP